MLFQSNLNIYSDNLTLSMTEKRNIKRYLIGEIEKESLIDFQLHLTWKGLERYKLWC